MLSIFRRSHYRGPRRDDGGTTEADSSPFFKDDDDDVIMDGDGDNDTSVRL